MPAEHALLGLLALERGTPAGVGRSEASQGTHGYDLARRFAAGGPLGEVLRLEPGMLYHHLKKLARRGWVEAEPDPQVEAAGGRPPRRRYRLTRLGHDELHRWLGEPVTHTREIRLEFLVKLYFAQRLDSTQATRLVAEQRARMARLAASLAEQARTLDVPTGGDLVDRAGRAPGAGADDRFRRQVLALRLAQTVATAAWLTDVAHEERDLTRGPPSVIVGGEPPSGGKA